MKRLLMALVAVLLAGSAAATVAGQAGAGQEQKAREVRGTGCIQPGVEARCLVVKDVMSGKLYNLLLKEPRPAIGDGIEFTGVPYGDMTVCMQGIPLEVTNWARKDSLKCTEGEAPRK